MNENSLALLRRALHEQQAGRPQEAEALYRRVLQADPSNPDALNLLGVLALQRGDYQMAADWISKAVRVSPMTASYQNNLGLALRGLGRLADAAPCFRAAARLEPELYDAHFNLGVVLQALDQVDQAIAAYEKALSLRKTAGALNNLGVACGKRGGSLAALRCFEQALELEPGHPDALYSLAMALQEGGQAEKAAGCFERRASLPNPPPELPFQLGTALHQCARLSEAETWYRKALKIHPSPALCNNLAVVLRGRSALGEAEQLLRQAISAQPDYAEAFSNLGNVLLNSGRAAEAEAAYDRAVQLQPGYVDAIYNRAHARLVLGDFEGGLSDYEYRWQWQDFPAKKPDLPEPEWAGDDLNGRALFVYHEQGLGDAIQFGRYFAVVAARGGTVLFACPAPLKTLFQDMPGLSGLVEPGQPKPPFDVHAPLMSLPRLCGTRRDTIPNRVPYLPLPSPERFPLPPRTRGRLRVGIVWAGGGLHPKDRLRSMTLDHFLPLLRSVQCEFYSLQAGPNSAEIKSLPKEIQMEDLGCRLRDFADSAAVMGQLDLILSVDTSTLHLPGALARPAWGLLPFAPDWRWMLDREDSPWYPTLRLFRQTRPGDWQAVVERVRRELERLARRYEDENLLAPPPKEWFLPDPALR